MRDNENNYFCCKKYRTKNEKWTNKQHETAQCKPDIPTARQTEKTDKLRRVPCESAFLSWCLSWSASCSGRE